MCCPDTTRLSRIAVAAAPTSTPLVEVFLVIGAEVEAFRQTRRIRYRRCEPADDRDPLARGGGPPVS
jgi:hypothetical protein